MQLFNDYILLSITSKGDRNYHNCNNEKSQTEFDQ